jgi:cytochrome c553
MTRLLLAGIAGVSLLMSAGAQAAGDAAAGKAKSAVCSACHGADGNSANPIWPNLAGQKEAYLVKQLKDFKSGARKDPMMAPMAAPLSDQDMENLAAYFSSQKQK